MNTIDHPPVRTYWITFDGADKDSVLGYGWTDPNQRTDTIHVWEITTDEDVWLARLLEYGIIPEFDEQGNLVI
jgi:hypothetical protein